MLSGIEMKRKHSALGSVVATLVITKTLNLLKKTLFIKRQMGDIYFVHNYFIWDP